MVCLGAQISALQSNPITLGKNCLTVHRHWIYRPPHSLALQSDQRNLDLWILELQIQFKSPRLQFRNTIKWPSQKMKMNWRGSREDLLCSCSQPCSIKFFVSSNSWCEVPLRRIVWVERSTLWLSDATVATGFCILSAPVGVCWRPIEFGLAWFGTTSSCVRPIPLLRIRLQAPYCNQQKLGGETRFTVNGYILATSPSLWHSNMYSSLPWPPYPQ